ncbi:C-type lectin domain family 17, member A-like [Eriocheir sinensis]|uniref:C-type lectin domain family 17, member A-like n=1 Tax=Eriocheir sinensis TaxID=95602 RepID=UPI0021C5C597|nr:C-type lectin domain family 17, member A-like [Eriocheir sinensis]
MSEGHISHSFFVMGPLRLLLLLLLGLAAFTPVTASAEEDEELIENMNSYTRLDCPSSFFTVGDRCVLVNPFLSGTWDESRFYCKTLGADMVQIESWEFYLAILEFLIMEGLDENSYWMGARDVAQEGEWRWEVGGELMTMGSPFWSLYFQPGYVYHMEPWGGIASNCARLDHKRYLYMDDDDCLNHNAVMCQVVPK